MSIYKKLLGQTAIYGISSIVGRLLNYFLVPLHTRVFNPEDYGVVSVLYIYVTFLIIVFTYGMETAYFRFASSQKENKDKIYTTVLISIVLSSIIFVGLISGFSGPIASWLDFPGKGQYVIWFAVILGLDAITSIPFANLRLENRPIKFVSIRLINIGVNVLLNLYFLVLCPYLIKTGSFNWLVHFYNPAIGIGYVFIANLVASIVTFLLLSKEFLLKKLSFDGMLWKQMMIYAIPLLFAGLAGMINQNIDRALLQHLLPGTPQQNLAQIGIYSAAYKIPVLLMLAIQAFRMAAEPFFFTLQTDANSKEIYAKVMSYFVVFACVVFLGIMLHLNIIQYFVGAEFRSAMGVVPVILIANIFFGIYTNLSIWYKLSDKTVYGLYFMVFGSIIAVGLNVLLIPKYGYHGSAFATMICFISMAVVCYFIGQKHYPVPYDVRKITGYLIVMLIVYGISIFLKNYIFSSNKLLVQVIDSILFVIYVLAVFFIEKPKQIIAVHK